jgi:glycosyltransferase involved in cell wall biosynthesis
MASFRFVSTMGGVAWGGSEELWAGAAHRLVKAGHRVAAHVFEWHPDPPKIAQLERDGARIVRRRRSSPYWRRAVTNLLGQPSSANPFARNDRDTPDLVVISQGYTLDGMSAIAACRQKGWRFAPLVQANGELFWPSDREAVRIREYYGDSVQNFFVSRRNWRVFCDQIGDDIRGDVVSNPFVVGNHPRVGPATDAGPLRLACVARLDPASKGQDVLLHVLAGDKWRARDVRVDFFGGGRCADLVGRMAARLKLGNVAFVGHVADVEQIWREHDALVLPSRVEGTPLALIEAMLCSRTAVVTDVAGNTELIEDNVSGFVAKAATEDLLDEALERAWMRRGEMASLGSAARKRVLEVVPPDPVGDFTNRLLRLVGAVPIGR